MEPLIRLYSARHSSKNKPNQLTHYQPHQKKTKFSGAGSIIEVAQKSKVFVFQISNLIFSKLLTLKIKIEFPILFIFLKTIFKKFKLINGTIWVYLALLKKNIYGPCHVKTSELACSISLLQTSFREVGL